jgi:predicted RNA binding protein YcfA (HicA-like mRNA interferase family)
MPKELPKVTAKEIIAVLEKEGFSRVRQRGSHKIYKNAQGKRATVPFHGSTILHPKVLTFLRLHREGKHGSNRGIISQ